MNQTFMSSCLKLFATPNSRLSRHLFLSRADGITVICLWSLVYQSGCWRLTFIVKIACFLNRINILFTFEQRGIALFVDVEELFDIT